MKRSKGFTLVELLAVVAIIGILMVVALPAYNNYSTKSKFAEVVLATAPTKTAISTCAVSGDCVSGNAIALGAAGAAGATPTLALLSTVSGAGTPVSESQAFLYAVTAAGYIDASYPAATANSIASNYAQTGASASGPIMVIHAPTSVWPANTYCIAQVSMPTTCAILPGSTTTIQSYLSSPINPYYAAGVGASSSSLANLPCVGGAGCSPSTKYAASVSFDASGVITATAVSGAQGLKAETFVLTPALSGGRVDWAASGTCKTRAGGALC